MGTLNLIEPTSGHIFTTIRLVGTPTGSFIAIWVKNAGTGTIELFRQSALLFEDPDLSLAADNFISLTSEAMAPGIKNIVIVDGVGESNAIQFTYLGSPEIDEVSDEGSFGTRCAIIGSGFSNTAAVFLDDRNEEDIENEVPENLVPAEDVDFNNSTLILFTVPLLSSGIGPKRLILTFTGETYAYDGDPPGVGNPRDIVPFTTTLEAETSFQYTGSVRITDVTPDEIEQFTQTEVTVTGFGFSNDSSAAIVITGINGEDLVTCTDFEFISANQITCTTPGVKAGDHRLRVTNPNDGFGDFPITFFRAPMLRGAGLVVKYTLPAVAVPVTNSNISVRATRASTSIPQLAEPPNRTPDTYDASATGLPVSRNHYFQGFDTVEMLLEALAAGHEDDGTSIVSLAGLKSGTRVTKRVTVTNSVTPVTTLLRAHGGDAWSAFQRLQSPQQQDEDGNVLSFPDGDTAFVTVGLAFDDTSIYAVHEYTLGVPSGIVDFLATLDTTLFQPDAAALPTIGARTYTNPAVDQHSWGAAAYQRELDNGTKLVAMYEAEHDIPTGNHKIPLSRFTGFAVAFDSTVSAPSGVGDRALVEIETVGTDRLYVAPSLVPQSGSGILQVSLAFGADNVYASIRRLTAGSTNSTRLVVWRVSA